MKRVLREIIASRSKRIAAYQAQRSAQTLRAGISQSSHTPPPDFIAALTQDCAQDPARSFLPAVIAELKYASPSKGVIREQGDLTEVAQSYQRAGAKALSVLTEEDYFQGSYSNLQRVSAATTLPLLCKDFVIDEYQILYARYCGASCVLLIVRILTDAQLQRFFAVSRELGMAALFEVHNHADLARALALDAQLIGINNRDLDTLKMDLQTTIRLRSSIPEGCTVVSESGIHQPAQLRRLMHVGVDAVLIGEALMQTPDPGHALELLLRQAA